jgi:oligopeptide transport system substrate-binding protein
MVRAGKARIAAALLALLLSWPGFAAEAGERVLHVMMRSEPASFDPPLLDSAQEFDIMLELLEGLTIYDAAGHTAPGTAERWEISPDGRLYTFHLRSDALWDDGTPVTADQFVAAARRWVEPATASPYTAPIEVVENATSILRGAKPPQELGVTAPDPHTLIIRLIRPDPYLLGIFTDILQPIRQEVIDRWGHAWTRPGHMPCNGPFVLSEWVPQGHVTLVRNPRYRAAADIHLDRIEFILVDADAALKMYQAGELDLIRLLSRQYLAALKSAPDAVDSEAVSGNNYLQLNISAPPLSDRRVRRALALALDQRTLFDRIAPGTALPSFSLVPKSLRYPVTSEEDFKDTPMPERIAEARRLMAEAGYGPDNRAALRFSYATSGNRNIPQAIQQMWETNLPVQVSLVAEEFQVWVKDRQNFDVTVDNLGLGDDPLAYVAAFRSDRPSDLSIPGYVDETVNGLLDQAENQVEPGARAELLARAESLLLADQPVIPIGSQLVDTLVGPRVHGWHRDTNDHHPLSLISVDP